LVSKKCHCCEMFTIEEEFFEGFPESIMSPLS